MEELVSRVTQAAGIDASVAKQAIGMILGFIQKEGPEPQAIDLLAKLPGAADLIPASEASGVAGGFGGLLGGGLMGLAGRLQGLGLDMGAMQTTGREVLTYAREKGGEDLVGEVVAGIPGLSQFL